MLGAAGSVGGCADRQVELQHPSCSQERTSAAQREWQGWGELPSPHRGSGLFLCFWKHRREVILLQERLPLPLKHCSCGGTDTQGAALVTPRPAGKGHLCSDFTRVMDGASCSQLGQEGEAAGRSSVSLPGAVGSLVPLQQPWAASVIHLGHSSGGAQMLLPHVWWWLE